MQNRWYIAIAALIFAACTGPESKLPVLGEPTVSRHFSGGKEIAVTTWPKIPPFSFTGQDGRLVTEKTFAGHIYVADFIFLSCPSICPKMTAEMKKVYDAFTKEDRVLFLSHTIDPERDTVPRLYAYAEAMHIDHQKWRFVTGDIDSIYKIAEKSYFSTATKDSAAPGGYIHGGGLLLVDTDRHIRGVYNGTNDKEAERLIADIKKLLKETTTR
ncbi:MAG TPA: SCO family protein [Chitinophaga sp.]|uniref:SCO family protein n=1 Tax=Chitinophaga sp. TaxID=1869181 RepID=UPI002B8C2279|nr:SCO family protein [Chitinophaga sp.]HVI43953.1 SCO family protein [Chitinophaga sp.]